MKIIKKSKEISKEDNIFLKERVSKLIQAVQQYGDKAVIECNTKFDQNARENLRVDKNEILEAYENIDVSIIENIKIAKNNIERFAQKQITRFLPLKLQDIQAVFGWEHSSKHAHIKP